MILASLAMASALLAQFPEGPGTQQSFNISVGEPSRNCPAITVRVVVTNQQGSRVSGLPHSSFYLSENESQREVSVSEVAIGEYALTFNATSTGLRMTINVTVRDERGSGYASRLTTSCALRVTCGDLPVATVGVPYTAQLQYTVPDGFFNPVLSIVPDTPILKVDPVTGKLTGQFVTPGNFDFVAFITIAGAIDGSFTAQQACQVRVDLPPITFTDYTPKSATQCSPGFPITVTGSGFLQQLPVPPQQANVGTFLVFDGSVVQGGVLNAAKTSLVSPVPGSLLTQFRSPIRLGISTRSAGIQNIDSASAQFTLRRPPNFAANFTQTSLQASSATGVTALNVDVLDLDLSTGLRIAVGSNSRFLKPRLVVGGRLVFDVPNELIAGGGTATISLVNGDEANPEGNPYAASCAPNSSRVLSLGPARPSITSLSPRTATACAPGFSLSINGANFAAGSTVEWEGSALPNPQILASSITVPVGADRLGVTARTVPITVTGGGAVSPSESFTVLAAPVLRPLTNPTLPIDSGDLILNATGANFVAGVTRVRAGSQLLTTGVQNAGQLNFVVPRALLAAPGELSFTAVNVDAANPTGAAGTTGGTCPAAITATVANPAASVRTLVPSSEIAASPEPVEITINGGGFLQGARVLVNGAAQDATFVDASQLKTLLSVTQLASPGTLRIGVQNPNAAASNTADFTVTAVPVPRFTITANPANPTSSQDVTLTVTQSEASARQLRATLSLFFEPNADNLPATGLPEAAGPLFSGGGTAFSYIVGTSLAPGGLLRPGSVAGTVIVRMTALTAVGSTVSLLPSPAPEVRVVVARAAPVIDSVRILPSAGGFDIEILATSTVRNVTSAAVQVNVVAGTRVDGESRFTVELTSSFNDWFRTAANLQWGGQFRVRLPFTLQNGDSSIVDSVSVTLANTSGTSTAVTGRR
jgi:hypothetical protein